MRILLVDDDANTRKMVAVFLKQHAEVVQAGNGDEALKCFYSAVEAAQPFDLILLDIVMPNKVGIEVLRAIRDYEGKNQAKFFSPTPIIMLTGSAEVNQMAEVQILGVTDYLMKPIQGSKLIRELQRLGFIKDPGDMW